MNEQPTIGRNSHVTFSYQLFDENGFQIDASGNEEPLSYIHGYDLLISGLEEKMKGKQTGEEFTVTLDPEDAYGERDENLVMRVERAEIPEEVDLQMGGRFTAINEQGDRMNLVVLDITDEDVVLDANHPLAGKAIMYKVKIKNVRQATGQELTALGVSPDGKVH